MQKPLSFYQPTMQIPDTTSGFDINNIGNLNDPFGMLQNSQIQPDMSFLQSPNFNPNPVAKKPSNNLKQQQLGNMLLALSDIYGGRNPNPGMMQRSQMMREQKERAERQANMQKNDQAFMESVKGTPYEDLAKYLNPNEIRKVITEDKINQFTQSGKNSATANMKNYEALIAIINDPKKSKEEKDIARSVYGVIGKTKQEFVSDSIGDLFKQTDVVGNPLYNQNNIQEAIPQLEKIYDLIFQNEETVSKYKIEELPNNN
jgi:hypothetical protein